MNKAAKDFADYLASKDIDSFKVEELNDEQGSVIFRSTLILNGQSIPVGIILSFVGGPFFLALILLQRKSRIYDPA